MKKMILLFSLGFFTNTVMSPSAHAFSFSAKPDPEVVQSVDFNRYVGMWYEVAHNPNFFQRNCKHSTAEYALIDSSSVSVHNTCYKEDGTTSDISGKATVTNPNEPAKLKVVFNLFARGDYWIVDLDANYQWAVVSGPGKSSLFILSRQPGMDDKLLQKILSNLDEKGFDTSNLIYDIYQ